MDANGQLHAPAALLLGKNLGTSRTFCRREKFIAPDGIRILHGPGRSPVTILTTLYRMLCRIKTGTIFGAWDSVVVKALRY